MNEKSYNNAQLRNATRQNIVHLLLHSLEFPAPNLAHFLLGYELRRPVSKTTLQLPGKAKYNNILCKTKQHSSDYKFSLKLSPVKCCSHERQVT